MRWSSSVTVLHLLLTACAGISPVLDSGVPIFLQPGENTGDRSQGRQETLDLGEELSAPVSEAFRVAGEVDKGDVPRVGEEIGLSHLLAGVTAFKPMSLTPEEALPTDQTCEDENIKCELWASSYTCAAFPTYMLTACRKTCRMCSASVHKMRAAQTTALNLCANFVRGQAGCDTLKEAGACDSAWLPMSLACRATCQTGPCHDYSSIASADAKGTLECADHSPRCFVWKLLGQCGANPSYMLHACQRSCGTCGMTKEQLDAKVAAHAAICDDFLPYCVSWMELGYCKSEERFVVSTCRKTCGAFACKPRPHVYLKRGVGTTVQGVKSPITLPQQDMSNFLQIAAGHRVQQLNVTGTVDVKAVAKHLQKQKDNEIMQKTIALQERIDEVNSKLPPRPEPCEDQHEHCAHWASTGQCKANPIFMFRFCKVSCERCQSTLDAITQQSIALLRECEDYSPKCHHWAQQGACQKYWLYMSLTCRAACKVGPCRNAKSVPSVAETEAELLLPHLKCKDDHLKCFVWLHEGKCSTEPDNMLLQCRRSCGTCDWSPQKVKEHVVELHKRCADFHVLCPIWKAQGKCGSQAAGDDFVKLTCRKSCDTCEGGRITSVDALL